jgi:hypothetical protein
MRLLVNMNALRDESCLFDTIYLITNVPCGLLYLPLFQYRRDWNLQSWYPLFTENGFVSFVRKTKNLEFQPREVSNWAANVLSSCTCYSNMISCTHVTRFVGDVQIYSPFNFT